MEIKFIKLEYILLILILLAAAFLRLWEIKDYIVFLGDQGRDVLIVKRIIVDHKLTLLGPTASVGGFYLGPFYYYLMILPLWLANFNPVGPAIMVAVFGIATVFLLYFFTKEIFGKRAGLLTAFLYAISPLVVKNSRFSWNPNTLPFFSLLYFYILYLGKIKKKSWCFFLAGIILGISVQLHYMALILAPIGVFLVFDKKIQKWLENCLYLLLGFSIAFSPFLLFEIRHGFGNSKAILEFVTRKAGAVAFYPFSLLPAFLEIFERIFANFYGLEKNLWIRIIVYFSFIPIFINFFSKEGQKREGIKIVLWWWLAGMVLLRIYQGTIYDYYFGYLYPIPAILSGVSLNFLLEKKQVVFKICAVILLAIFLFFSLKNQSIWKKSNKVLEQTERISKSVIDYSQDKPFNFALISPGNSDHAYRYFLEINQHKPVPLEERVEEQLFVICEQEICEPLGHPLWEIAAFGRAEIAQEWEDKAGIKIFKLIHHQDSIDWIGKPAPKGM